MAFPGSGFSAGFSAGFEGWSRITRLGSYGGPRGLYGAFVPKEEADGTGSNISPPVMQNPGIGDPAFPVNQRVY